MVPQIRHNNSLYFNVPSDTRHQNESNDVQHIYIYTYIQTCIHIGISNSVVCCMAFTCLQYIHADIRIYIDQMYMYQNI